MTTKAPARPRVRHSREEVRELIVSAAIELVRDRSFYELSVSDVMERAGLERTIFYRHFDDLSDLLLLAATDALQSLYAAEVELGPSRESGQMQSVRAVMERAAGVYSEHGPLIRAVTEAGASNAAIRARGEELRRSFNQLTAKSLARTPVLREHPPADLDESARALNLLNEAYLRDCFGREPRVSVETAVQTLTEIWFGFIKGASSGGGASGAKAG